MNHTPYSDHTMKRWRDKIPEKNYQDATMISVVLLVMTLHNMRIVSIGIKNSREYQELTDEFVQKVVDDKAKQKRILDAHRRVCGDAVTRQRDPSWGDFSKERHRHDSRQRTQWIRTRRAR
jgi:hypothetical protein